MKGLNVIPGFSKTNLYIWGYSVLSTRKFLLNDDYENNYLGRSINLAKTTLKKNVLVHKISRPQMNKNLPSNRVLCLINA